MSWVAARASDTMSILGSDRFSSDRRRARRLRLSPQGPSMPWLPGDIEAVFASMPMFVDRPKHGRLRAAAVIGTDDVKRVQRSVRSRVMTLLGTAREMGSVDVVAQLARPVATAALAELLGVSPGARSDLDRWATQLEAAIDPPSSPDVGRGCTEAITELASLIDDMSARSSDPSAGLLSRLLVFGDADGPLPRSDVVATAALLLAVGRETVMHLLSTSVLELLEAPDERLRLGADPSLLPLAVEELLRFTSPAQLTSRVAIRDVAIDGGVIPAGDVVVVLLGAANRDSAWFQHPDRLDVGRVPNRHFAFGYGTHACLGARLARMQAREMLSALLAGFPGFDGDPAAARWSGSLVHRGLEELRITL